MRIRFLHTSFNVVYLCVVFFFQIIVTFDLWLQLELELDCGPDVPSKLL